MSMPCDVLNRGGRRRRPPCSSKRKHTIRGRGPCTSGFRSPLFPLWVRSGHHISPIQFPAFPPQRRTPPRLEMSASCQSRPKALQQTAYSITSSAAVPGLTDRLEAVRKVIMLEHLNPTPQKPSRVVVLGAYGFVGGSCARRLAARGVP